MLSSPHTLKTFFKEHETKGYNNQEMKSFFDQCKTPKSVVSWRETAKQEKIVSFLCKSPYGEGLVLIHNLTTIGGDRLNPTVMNAAVIGVDIDAFISQVDSLSLYKNNITTFPLGKTSKKLPPFKTFWILLLLLLLLQIALRSLSETASQFPHLYLTSFPRWTWSPWCLFYKTSSLRWRFFLMPTQ